MTTRDMLTLAEVSDLTGWSVDLLRRLCRTDSIDHHRFGGCYYLTVAQYEALKESTLHKARPRELTKSERQKAAIASARTANITHMRRRGAA